ncbi:hypothetical protein [Novipirellula artificiosorum]|uniref:Uncharacterized protein n=1 Tax=Novipirellula artificiosorum TaxID=2528016 RepID=A0A5C6DCM6_9BACT|nr:hypothetical protein [Novipirellula artificiosorum]TWU32966.1 hypothetical protein Poly41_53450 [Novipirellula artificiosorum]
MQPKSNHVPLDSIDSTGEDRWTHQPGDHFLRRVRQSASHVLADSPAGREVLELCDEHAEARRMILEDRNRGATVVAIVGATGQGKSWLVRQMVRQSPVAASIRSGNNVDEATEKLVWIGPSPPADLDSRFELYLHCDAKHMQPIGMPYMMVDAPGATDDRQKIAAVAARAISLASAILLVVRRDQLRSQSVGMLAEASEGSVVIPLVNAVRDHDDLLDADMEAFSRRMRELAPTSMIARPIVIEDFEIEGRSESKVAAAAAEEIGSRLETELGQLWEGDRRRSARLSALDARFRNALHGVMSDQLPGLTSAVRRINREAREIPTQVAETLVGGGGPLRAAVRARLRLALLAETSAIWFPYRSQLGLLNLTHGAWDRVMISLSGSLPSLIGAVWTSTKNLTAQQGAEQDIREGLRQRSAAAVSDRLGPLASRFRSELADLRKQGSPSASATPTLDDDSRTQVAYLGGIDSLQEMSQRIFDEEVERVSISRFTAFLFALIGTMVFWGLMAGPVVALYRGYFDASFMTLRNLQGDLESFPRPDLAMMLTSLLLSLLPTAIFSMLVLSYSQGRRRVQRAEEGIRGKHDFAISHLQKQGVLRLRWEDPLLADAEFLLSVGAAEKSEKE